MMIADGERDQLLIQQDKDDHSSRADIEARRSNLHDSNSITADGLSDNEAHQSIIEGIGAESERLRAQYSEDSSNVDGDEVILLGWRDEEKAPIRIVRYCNAVVGENVVYCAFVPDIYSKEEIHAFHMDSKWCLIPHCQVYTGFSIAVVNGLLTTIGGYGNDNKDTNKLLSLISAEEGSDKQWTEQFPPMPSKRYNVSALCTESSLIVVGGRKGNGVCLKTVEVMNTDTRQWHSTNPLPERLSCSSMTICDDRIYLLGGVDKHGKWTHSVYSCSPATLLIALGGRVVRALSRSNSQCNDTWTKVADLPVIQATAVSLFDQLIAVGGCDSSNEPTADIRRYDTTTNTWEVISRMATPRRRCLAAVLPDNQLMVVGGFMCDDEIADSVEFGE